MANIFNSIVLPILIIVQITNVSTENENGLRISWKDVKVFKVYSTLSPDVTEDCLRYGICAKVSNYPTKIAEWALEQLNEKQGITEGMTTSPEDEAILFSACDISEKVIHPKVAKSSEGKWHFILNLDNKPFQGFYTNICSSDQCSKLMQPANSECTQEYTLRTMIYLDMENEMVAEKMFKVPTRCSCKIFCSN